jgi:hypothetical protein
MLAPIHSPPMSPIQPSQKRRLTDNNRAFLGEVVCGDLEVERGRSLSYAARDVVVGAVAGAEPAAKVAGLADGDASEMGADAYYSVVSINNNLYVGCIWHVTHQP